MSRNTEKLYAEYNTAAVQAAYLLQQAALTRDTTLREAGQAMQCQAEQLRARWQEAVAQEPRRAA